MQFIEGTHDMRRDQSSTASYRFKEVVDDTAQVGHFQNRMARENGPSIRLDKLHAHEKLSTFACLEAIKISRRLPYYSYMVFFYFFIVPILVSKPYR